jgi:exopolysaccharide biosynthesis WecB/TagA/CpsF family protein
MDAQRRYVLLSPCRDEAAYMRRTLDSVAAQTISPSLWVIVDDGSTDGTSKILDEYEGKLPYLRVVHLTDRGRRAVGPGVIDAFHHGLQTVNLDEFEYLCKLDMDLELPPRYFELLIERMEREPQLGTCSGKPWFVHPRTGEEVPEVCGNEMSAGMTKFYRVACYREIGGFVRQVMWDGIDCHRARMFGWNAESVNDRELRFLHLRPQGSSEGRGIWSGRVRAGFGQYFMGTSPLYYLAVAIYRLPKHPILYGSIGMLWGYFSSWLKRLPRYEDRKFRRFLRRYQRNSLLMGKAAATRKAMREQAAAMQARTASKDRRPAGSDARAELLGLPFDVVTMQGAVDRCLAWCSGPRTPHTVVTANSATLCMVRRDPALRKACLAADLIVPDGMSVVWTSRLTKRHFPERIAGVDLMSRLLESGSEVKLRVYFLGAKPQVVATLAKLCAERFPGLAVSGYRDGYFSPADDTVISDEIRELAPQMLFVGMPSPFKETWCERNRERLKVPVMIGVGGSFDVLAGYVRRAPTWVQSMGMEWSWRLMMEPRKMWKRYLATNSEFVWMAGREILSRWWGRPAGDGSAW